jgi:hypothetical protein
MAKIYSFKQQSANLVLHGVHRFSEQGFAPLQESLIVVQK